MRRKGAKKSMWIVCSIMVVLVIGLIVFFSIPYSKLKSEFKDAADELMQKSVQQSEVFTVEDIEHLPLPVQRYFNHCGYIGKPKMAYMAISFHDVDFVLSPDKPKMKIDYTQYNSVHEPLRIAFIDTSMYGIPFQGLDSYVDGIGRMKGVIAKGITLFNQTGAEMDRASLVTFLSESLVLPNAALQPYITWEAIDDLHAKATISYYGIEASGIFTFNERGQALSFTTNDRTLTATDGSKQQVPWSAQFSEYRSKNGIQQPTHLQAVWHYDEGDLVYFDSDQFIVENERFDG